MAVLAVSPAKTTLLLSLTVFYRPPLTCKPSQLFSTLENTIIIFLFLKKFCITIVFSFSQDKLKTTLYKTVGGTKRLLWYFLRRLIGTHHFVNKKNTFHCYQPLWGRSEILCGEGRNTSPLKTPAWDATFWGRLRRN